MPYDPMKDTKDPGDKINIADIGECGQEAWSLTDTETGYFIDINSSLSATRAQYSVNETIPYAADGVNFAKMFDGKTSSYIDLPPSDDNARRYLYIKLRDLYRLRQLNVKTTGPTSFREYIRVHYNVSTGASVPTSGWVALTVSTSWNSNDGYVAAVGGGSCFDACWLRIEDNIGWATPSLPPTRE